jgi:hypothetical protein
MVGVFFAFGNGSKILYPRLPIGGLQLFDMGGCLMLI